MTEYESWTIASWGRTGSVATTNMLLWHMRQQFPQAMAIYNALETRTSVLPIEPYTVYHCHSLAQLNLLPKVEKCGVVLSVRQPSISAISCLVAKELGTWHMHNPNYINELKKRLKDPSHSMNHDYYKSAIKEYDTWLKSNDKKFNITIDMIKEYRTYACQYNQTAVEMLNSISHRVKYVEYDKWQGDLNMLAHLIGIAPVSELYMIRQKDLRHWSHHLNDADTICTWVESMTHEDCKLLAGWENQLYN